MQLNSERLTYTTFTAKDMAGYARLVMDENVMKYITGLPLTLEESEDIFKKKILVVNKLHPEAGYFSVKLTEENIFIGLAKLAYVNPQEAEIGYMLLPAFWGKNYASEMVQCLINYAVTIQKIKTLMAIVDPANPASIKVLIKHGFRLYKTGIIDDLPAEYYRLVLVKQ